MIKIKTTDKGKYYFQVTADNGEPLTGIELYHNKKQGALRGLQALRKQMIEWDGKTYYEEKKSMTKRYGVTILQEERVAKILTTK